VREREREKERESESERVRERKKPGETGAERHTTLATMSHICHIKGCIACPIYVTLKVASHVPYMSH
jgi:hypothetical protein